MSDLKIKFSVHENPLKDEQATIRSCVYVSRLVRFSII